MKKLFAIISALVLCLVFGVAATAADTVYYDEGSGLYFEIQTDGGISGAPYAAIVAPPDGSNYSGISYEIPRLLAAGDHYLVMKIDNDAFKDSSITTLTFQADCQLYSIGENAFQNCTNLTGYIDLPESVSHIASSAFVGCTNENHEKQLVLRITVAGTQLLGLNLDKFSGSIIYTYAKPYSATLSDYGVAAWSGPIINCARYKLTLYTVGDTPFPQEVAVVHTEDTETKTLTFGAEFGERKKYYYTVQIVSKETYTETNISDSAPVSSNLVDRTVIYTLAYDENGGEGTKPRSEKYIKDRTATVASASLTKDGMAFSHWNTEANGSGTSYNAGDSIVMSSDITLYAQYKDPQQSAEEHKHGETVFAAFDPANTVSGSFFLSDNITASENIVIGDGTNETSVTLCLNGKTLSLGSHKIEVKANAALNICDCQTAQGKIESSGTAAIENSGSVNIGGGTVKCAHPENLYDYNDYYGIINNGTLNVTGGTVIANRHGILNNSTGKVTVSGGTVSASHPDNTRPGGTGLHYGIHNDGGKVEISGGTVTSTKNGPLLNKNGGDIKVSGGYLDGDYTVSSIGIVNRENCTLTVTGGTIVGTWRAVDNHGTAEITGGTLTGEKGFLNYPGAVLTVSGGEITGTEYGLENKGTAEITGGTITGGTYGIYILSDGSLTQGENVTVTGTTEDVYVESGFYQGKYYRDDVLHTGTYNEKYYKDGVVFTGMAFGEDGLLYEYTDGTGVLFTGEYEGKRYEDGVLFTGEYEGKLYEDGVLFTGEYEGKLYEDGVLFTGEYEGKRYEDGVLFTGEYEGKLYEDGELFTGEYEGKLYEDGELFSGEYEGKLYEDGVVFTGMAFGEDGLLYEYTDGTGVLFTGEYEGKRYEDGVLFTGEYEGKLYEDGVLFTGTHKNRFYKDGELFTGTYKGKEYKNGVEVANKSEEKPDTEENPNTGGIGGVGAVVAAISAVVSLSAACTAISKKK